MKINVFGILPRGCVKVELMITLWPFLGFIGLNQCNKQETFNSYIDSELDYQWCEVFVLFYEIIRF